MDPRDIYSLEQFHPSKITRPGRASPHNESQNIRRHQKRARNEAVPVGSEGRQPASTETIRAIQTPIRITRRTATACDRCYQGHRKVATVRGPTNESSAKLLTDWQQRKKHPAEIAR